jgi:nucleotide-binding universal stress UspA family protein
MKKILIALDYDPSAQKVAESGYLLAQTMDAEVTLLHVMSDPTYYSEIGHVKIMGFAGHMDTNIETSKIKIEPEKFSQDFLNKSKLHLGNNNIDTIVKEGKSAESILKTAKEIKADLIIMGSHSRKWFKNIAIGSVTEKVLINTVVPVIIIPVKHR